MIYEAFEQTLKIPNKNFQTFRTVSITLTVKMDENTETKKNLHRRHIANIYLVCKPSCFPDRVDGSKESNGKLRQSKPTKDA